MNHQMWKTGRFDPKTIEKIRHLTDVNDHSAAKVLGAWMLGDRKLIKKMELVQELHKLEGHLPGHLYKYSYELYQEMMDKAERSLKPEEFEAFRSVF
jgi:hypothetical protein